MAHLKIMTFNIASCHKSQHGITDVANAIKDEHPDLVGLQELDKFTHRSGPTVDQLHELSRLTGLSHSTFIHSMELNGGQTGNAILSRHAFDTVELHHLRAGDPGETKSLGIISTKIFEEGRLYFGVLHLEHKTENLREKQAKEVIELCQRIVPEGEPFILAGVFNDSSTSRTLEHFLKHGGFQIPCEKCPKTFPAHHPRETLDYILLNAKAMEMFEVKSYRAISSEHSSDHIPVIVELTKKQS